MKTVLFLLLLLLLNFVVFISAESSNEVYLNKYNRKGCKGDLVAKELVYTLNECTKSTKYGVDGSKVLQCNYQDSVCVDKKGGECEKIHTLNECLEDTQNNTSRKYVLGADPSPFVLAFFVIGVFSAIMYVNKKKTTALPIPSIPQPIVPPPPAEDEVLTEEEEDVEEEEIVEEKSPVLPKPSGNAIKDVENHLEAILHKLQVSGPISKIGDCKYQIGSKKVTMQVLSGYLVVRVGGGFMKFEEWIQRFGRKEGLMIAGELVKGVGVSTLNSHGGHTIKPIPYTK